MLKLNAKQKKSLVPFCLAFFFSFHFMIFYTNMAGKYIHDPKMPAAYSPEEL